MKPNRNDPCPCGSGKKYKHCCLHQDTVASSPSHSASEPTTSEIVRLEALFSGKQFSALETATLAQIERYPYAGICWKLLGLSLQMQGKDALPALKKAAELLPADAEAHANLAAVLRAAGQWHEALASGRQALAIRPDFAEAHNNLGVVLQDLGQVDEAIACYRKAISIQPNFTEAYSNLGSALKDLEQFDAAIDSYQRALRINPNHARVHSNLGVIQQSLARFDEAAASYKKALEIDPLCNEAMLGISQMCIENGETETAEGLLGKLLQINPDNLAARLSLVQIKKSTPNDENMRVLIATEEALRNNRLNIPAKQQIHLYFALGKCFEDCGDYERAFPHFMHGCQLKRATFEHDANQVSRQFDNIMHVFDEPTIARLRQAGNPSSLPIFVLGVPRSGTTLVEQILSSHPAVYGAGELPDFLDIIQRDASGHPAQYPDNIARLQPETLREWASEYLAGLQKRAPEAQRITDKMPGNFLALGMIHLMLPNAKIIHVQRNPVDTCLSCFTQMFTVGQYQSYDLTEMGRYYVDYSRLMAHWRNVLPAHAFLDVCYENIVSDPETQTRRIIEFCGLDWQDDCLNFHKNKRAIQTASVVQARQPIYTSSVARWKRYEKFLNPLFQALGDLAERP